MLCPNCEESMESGYLLSPGSGLIRWLRDKTSLHSEGETVTPVTLFMSESVPGYRCTSCNTVVITSD